MDFMFYNDTEPTVALQEALMNTGKYISVKQVSNDPDNIFEGVTMKCITHRTHSPNNTNMLFNYHFDGSHRLRLVVSTNEIDSVIYKHRTLQPVSWYKKVADTLFH
jgi:hypothetical protein